MSRKHKLTEAELKHLIISGQIGALAAVRGGITDEIDRPDVPNSVRSQYTLTLELLDAAIEGLEAEKKEITR